MCSAWCPPHLLFLDHTFGHDLVDRGFHEAGGDQFVGAVALTVVWDVPRVGADVATERERQKLWEVRAKAQCGGGADPSSTNLATHFERGNLRKSNTQSHPHTIPVECVRLLGCLPQFLTLSQHP